MLSVFLVRIKFLTEVVALLLDGERISLVCNNSLYPFPCDDVTKICIKTGQAGKYQHVLKKIELPLVPHPTCQNSLRKTRLGQAFRLHESFVCAGGEPGRDTCKVN